MTEETAQDTGAEVESEETVEQQAEREEAQGQLDSEGNAVESGGEQGSQDSDDASEKRSKRVQKRIDELTRKRHEALREAEQLREENRKLKESQPVQPPADDPRPNFDAYDSIEDFQRDLESWSRRQAQREQQSQPEQSSGPTVDEQQAIDRVDNAAIEAADRYPDFDQVVRDPSLPITKDVLIAASETDSVADVLYHLGKNPQEAHKVSQLTGQSLSREIGRIEAKLEASKSTTERSGQSQQQPDTGTSAPEPIQTLQGKRSGREPRPSEMSTEEFIKWRNEQERGKRR